MKTLDIALTSLRRFLRDRSNAFFVFIFPLLLVLAIGLVFGGGARPVMGMLVVEPDSLTDEVVARLEANDSIETVAYDNRADLELAVERGVASAGVVIPAGYEKLLLGGESAVIEYFAQPGSTGASVGVAVSAAIAEQSSELRAAQAAASITGGELSDALATVRSIDLPGVEVTSTSAFGNGDIDPANFGQFGFGAAQQLALFVWVTSLTTATYLIQNRQLGVVRRMAATPTGAARIMAGELLGRFGIALTQAAFVVIASAVLFQVDWGPPLAAGALVLSFCLVGTGAGMLLGSLLRNEQQAGSIGLGIGLGLAALGGSMVPLEVFSPGMNRLAHFLTPHAWLIDGFTELVGRGGGLADIANEVLVLTTAGVVLTGLALLAFRHSLTRAI